MRKGKERLVGRLLKSAERETMMIPIMMPSVDVLGANSAQVQMTKCVDQSDTWCETKRGVKGNPRFFMSNFKDGVSINKDVEGYESKIWWGKIRSSVLDLLSLK